MSASIRTPDGDLAALLADNARLRQWLTLRVEDRLVDYLASLPGEDMPDGSRKLVRPPSQQEMGEAVGCSREAVNRAVNAMRRRGEVTFGRTDTNRPVVLFLSAALLERAGQIRSAR
jgi:CRP-like cAMP-binding protein